MIKPDKSSIEQSLTNTKCSSKIRTQNTQDETYELRGTHFVWNKRKGQTNIKKHRVSFEEAAGVLLSPSTIFFADDEHSDEERLVAIGFSDKLRLLVVCNCMRNDEKIVRIFSARKASKPEQNTFESR